MHAYGMVFEYEHVVAGHIHVTLALVVLHMGHTRVTFVAKDSASEKSEVVGMVDSRNAEEIYQ